MYQQFLKILIFISNSLDEPYWK